MRAKQAYFLVQSVTGMTKLSQIPATGDMKVFLASKILNFDTASLGLDNLLYRVVRYWFFRYILNMPDIVGAPVKTGEE